MEKGHTQIRILQILSKFDNGGIESFIMNYYRSLDKNKFQFDFVCDENSTIPYENNRLLTLLQRIFQDKITDLFFVESS